MKDISSSLASEWELHQPAPTVGEAADHHGASADELKLIERLRQGDEDAFSLLIDRHHGSMVRLALAHVADRSVAEEVVQESWIGVLEGIRRFEGRSSLKTWIFRIVVNKAKTRGVRESRQVPFSPLDGHAEHLDEPSVDPSRFRSAGHWADYWVTYPEPWDEETPERSLLTKEGTAYLEKAIAGLPANLRQVLVLRDVEGLSAKEACSMLGITEVNQRVLLHRARGRVRQALETYIKGDSSTV